LFPLLLVPASAGVLGQSGDRPTVDKRIDRITATITEPAFPDFIFSPLNNRGKEQSNNGMPPFLAISRHDLGRLRRCGLARNGRTGRPAPDRVSRQAAPAFN